MVNTNSKNILKICKLFLTPLFFLFITASCSTHYHDNNNTTQVTAASFDTPKRLLLLDGEKGSVACRVYGHLMSGTIPRISSNGHLESATRSLLRLI